MARVTVRVKPGSTKRPLIVNDDDGVTVFLKERAVDGKANDGLIRALAEHFDVAKSRVTIIRGHAARTKIVEIDSA